MSYVQGKAGFSEEITQSVVKKWSGYAFMAESDGHAYGKYQ